MNHEITALLLAALLIGQSLILGVLLYRWITTDDRRDLAKAERDNRFSNIVQQLLFGELRTLILDLDRLEQLVSVGALLPRPSLGNLVDELRIHTFIRKWSPTDLAQLPEAILSDLLALQQAISTALSRIQREYDRAVEQDRGAMTARTMILFRTTITDLKREIDTALAKHDRNWDRSKPPGLEERRIPGLHVDRFANEA